MSKPPRVTSAQRRQPPTGRAAVSVPSPSPSPDDARAHAQPADDGLDGRRDGEPDAAGIDAAGIDAAGTDALGKAADPHPGTGTDASLAADGPAPAGSSADPPAPDGSASDKPAPDGHPTQHAAPAGETAVTHALVQRAQAGDADAFGELYDRYVDMVYRYVLFRVSSPQLAEDLTSETFLRALRRLGSFTWQGRDVGAWFVTIARNLVADHYKSGRYRLELTTDDVAATGAALTVEGFEGGVLDALRDAELLDVVRRLGPEQQECIVLRFLQGLSVAETAQVMGKNEGAVKALQYRAVRALGRLLPDGITL